MKCAFLVLILLFSSCKGQEKRGRQQDVSEQENLMQLIESDFYSGTDEEGMIVVTDRKSLLKFYAQVNRTRKPGLVVPEVDFGKEMLLIYCAGKQQGASLPRLFVKNTSDSRLVLGVETTKGEASSTALTSPFSIYSLPLTQKQIIVE
ncbi:MULTISPECIES: hypothetical protein [Zobellia]|uniref:hypothetical protein n=1 Tax=Zobellia TaxID=112040 RepID=UPI000B531E0E|nr:MULTISPECIES: hypothetical protein [Zobellia]MBU3024396.1 hypothetical protein [Zobellia galactanivorans]OWW24214.1 hypothetical protein B4Q04_17210 [Zobellia sp. OII3]